MHVAAILAQGQPNSCFSFFPLLVFSSGTKQDGYLRTASLPTALVLRNQLRPLTECALSQTGGSDPGFLCALGVTVLLAWACGFGCGYHTNRALARPQASPSRERSPTSPVPNRRPAPGASPVNLARRRRQARSGQQVSPLHEGPALDGTNPG